MSLQRAILPHAIILPPNNNSRWTRRRYKPPCSQYNNTYGGEIRTSSNGMIVKGNCSKNPPGQPWDFVCYNINGQTTCHSSRGEIANSYQQICCPQFIPNPRPRPPRRSCCRGNDFNACALCLDFLNNTTDAASHQANMVKCRNNCGLF